MPGITTLRGPRGPRGPRGSRLSSRPFYTTLFLISLLAAYSFISHTYRGSQQHEDLRLLTKRGDAPECADVHRAKDQCAFIKEFCLDDDAGLIPYLTFYYCGFGKVKALAFIILVAWLGLLFTTIGIAASDFFSVNLSAISTMLGLSESLAGVTFLAFGNGSPDVFSTFAAMNSNSASMAVGELIGAASFISGVVAGSMALVREFRVDRKTYARDICFFIVAVSFTMVFLADGHLHFWECWIMIGYYFIYVLTVVGQHWYTTRRRRRLRREGEARSHVYGSVATSVDELAGEPYRDDPDEVDHPHGDGAADVSALEHGPRIEVDAPEADAEAGVDQEDEEDHERQVAAEVASSMRVLRTRGRRSNTINPIRPSLVGALEFRSALAQLQRESNLRMSIINSHRRSLSEAHLHNRERRRTTGAQSVVEHRAPHTIAGTDGATSGRIRALSSGNQPTSSTLPPEMLVPHQEQPGSGRQSPTLEPAYTIGGNLAPPPPGGTSRLSSGSISPMTTPVPGDDREEPPGLHLQIPGSHGGYSSYSSQSDGSSPSSPFPMYTDSPAVLTPLPGGERPGYMRPGSGQRNLSFADLHVPAEHPRPVKWWPYAVLPPPHVLYATLFPTLQGWREKTIWDKLVSAISIPSIFLLVITLPVVEADTNEEDSVVDTVVEPLATRHASHVASAATVEPHIHERETEWQRYRRRTLSRAGSYHSLVPSTPPLVSVENEDTLVGEPSSQVVFRPSSPFNGKPASEIPSVDNANDETMPWNRWLVCLQLFTGPLFAIFILWANLHEDFESPGKTLVRMILYTLLGSFILLAILLVFTTEQRKPKYHYFLCFLGFILSIAWISTVAGEVVGVLKTFGVVLGISEALLGLTIFAAGNSVGDLVADITIARLGYPVMAL